MVFEKHIYRLDIKSILRKMSYEDTNPQNTSD